MKISVKLRSILIFTSLLLILCTSCKKDAIQKKEPVNVDKIKAAIPTFQFDWETADFMPSPPGANPVLVPWASGSTQLFSDEIAFDFKKSDGWVLVYNTFSPTLITSPNFFALYNKYRGILRFYLYIPPGNPNASSYFSDGLATAGLFSSVLMNYSTDVTDLDRPINSMTRIQNYQIQSTGAWYASQYEIAYDPNIGNANQQNLNFIWNTSSTNISNVVLDGDSNGTLTGTVATESPGGFNIGTMFGRVYKGALYATGLKAVGGLKLNNANLQKEIESGLKGGLIGAVRGFFNAIIGGSPSTPQLVNLTLTTKMSLTGTVSNNSGISSPTLAIPGTQINEDFIGYVPSYENALGLLYMREKPTLRLEEDSKDFSNSFVLERGAVRLIGPLRRFHKRFFNQYNNQEKIIYNPVLVNEGVTFKVLREDIVIPCDSMEISDFNRYFQPVVDLWAWEYEPESQSGVDSRMEIIGNKYYAALGSKDPLTTTVADLNSWVRPTRPWGDPIFVDNLKKNDAFIRFTILVTPPNGGKPITLVKSFKADIIR